MSDDSCLLNNQLKPPRHVPGLNNLWAVKSLTHYQVPVDFREPFITSGYRSSRSSVTSCLLSAFRRTNETLNFWTQFIPFLVFARITLTHVHDVVVVDGGDIDDRSAWPLIVFLLSSCLYLMTSAIAHLFNSVSRRVRYALFFVDYCGVSIYSLGCCVAYYAYVFPPELITSLLYHVYLPVAMITAVLSTFIASYSRFAANRILRESGRLPAFTIPYIWCSIPLLYRVTFCHSTGCNSDARFFHCLQFVFAVMTAVFYSTRFPECIAPVRFDIVGHSHQMFHMGGVATTYSQYLALSMDMASRRRYLFDAVGAPSFSQTFGVILTVLTANCVVICALLSAFLPTLHPRALNGAYNGVHLTPKCNEEKSS